MNLFTECLLQVRRAARLLCSIVFLAPLALSASQVLFDSSGNLQSVSTPISQKPAILEQPANWIGAPGATAAFYVRVAPDPTDTFQWRKNGVIIAGATTESLSVASVTGASEGFFTVTITNPKGSVTSRAARLALDSDGDGMADYLEKAAFGSLDKSGIGDADGDGISNAEELADGTNPNDRNSRYYRLSLTASNGTIEASPASATGRYAPGTKVVLTAKASEGFTFIEWLGQGSGVFSSITVTMNADAAVEAIFGSTLGIALDAPELIWQTGPDAPWTGQGTIGLGIDSDWGQSAALTNPGQSWCAAYVDGPATLSFQWQVPSGSAATLSMYVDNSLYATATANSHWEQRSISVPAGRHLVRWVWEKASGAATTPDVALLNAVAVSTSASVTLAQALDAGELTWSTDRMNPWFGTDQVSHDGADSAQVVLNGEFLSSWLETRVNGPGQLSFWAQSSYYYGGLTVSVDGVAQSLSYYSWTETILKIVGAGPHVIRWTADNAYNANGNYGLDQVAWLPGFVAPAAPVAVASLATALDNTSLTFTTGGAKPWTVSTTTTYYGSTAQAGAIADNAESWIETRISGPAQVYFYWRVQCGPGDKMQVLVDGEARAFITGSTNFAQSSVTIAGQGLHTVRWRYVKDGSGAAGLDTAWLDYVYVYGYSPPAPAVGTLAPALADAVDLSALKPRTGGNAAWTADTAISKDGTDSARSGVITDGQESWMEMPVTGAGKLTFFWKVSSEATYDYLALNVDGIELTRTSGEHDWVQKTFNLTGSGTHLLRWRYVKDSSLSSGLDAAWVDLVTWSGKIPTSTAVVSPLALTVGPQAGSYYFNVNDTGSWTTSENLPWTSFNTAGGSGNSTVYLSVLAQSSGARRTGVVTVADYNIVINQEGYPIPTIKSTTTNQILGVGVPYGLSALTGQNFAQVWSATGLPPGIVINSSNGYISGTPTAVGKFSASLYAGNPAGKSAPVRINFIVRGPTVADYSGDYIALLPAGDTLTGDLGGVVRMKVTAGKSVTGSVQFGKAKLPFTGAIRPSLAGNQTLTTTVPRTGTTALGLSLEFDTSRWIGFVSGKLTGDGETLDFSGWKNLWSAKSNPATALAANYNSALDLEDSAQVGQAAIPQGKGFLQWTVTTAGAVSYTGRTADGAVVSGSSILWPDGQAPLYNPLYDGTGSVHGLSGFEADGTSTGHLLWTKLSQTVTPPPRDYKAGFGPVPLAIDGSRWVAPAGTDLVLGLPPGPDNAHIAFAAGGIESAAQFPKLAQDFQITKTAALFSTSATANPAGVQMTFDPAKGTFTGSLTLTDSGVSRPVTFQGVFLSGEGMGVGYFTLPQLPLGAPPSSAILSGSVLISPADR